MDGGKRKLGRAEGDKNAKRVRKYEDKFIEFGFTYVVEGDIKKPQCVICSVVLSAESMKPNKLQRHLETKHKEQVGKRKAYFVQLTEKLEHQKTGFKKAVSVTDKALRASFEVSYRIAQCKKPHTIGENLILPAAIDMVRIMFGENEAQKLNKIPLSDNTVKRRVDAIGANQEETLVHHLRNTEAYALQADVNTEGRTSHFDICAIYLGNQILEDILCCLPLPEHETAAAMFTVLNDYITTNNIPWDKMVGFCTDGAPSMAGCNAGLQVLIKEVAPSVVWTHCMIHREALAAKELSNELDNAMKHVVSLVNFIKMSPLRERIFAKVCNESAAEHDILLFYTSACWLSRGKVLQRFFELRGEIRNYAMDVGKNDLVEFLSDNEQMCLVAYLADIFAKLNELNTSLQGNNRHILLLSNKIRAFERKAQFWQDNLISGRFDAFSNLNSFINDNEDIEPPTHPDNPEPSWLLAGTSCIILSFRGLVKVLLDPDAIPVSTRNSKTAHE